MITENYVSFETAKLLKEKGFDEPCQFLYFSKYKQEGDFVGNFNTKKNSEINEASYSAPTLQMAVQWIQETHNILIVADYDYECTDTSWCFKVYRLGENGKPERVAITGTYYDYSGEHKQIVGYRDYERSYEDYATREEAEDDGIRYVLENYIS